MSGKNFVSTEIIKEDFRLHENDIVRIDLTEEIITIIDMIENADEDIANYFDLSYTDGYYLPNSDVPVDVNKVPEEKKRLLRRFPRDNPKISSFIKRFIMSDIVSMFEYREAEGLVGEYVEETTLLSLGSDIGKEFYQLYRREDDVTLPCGLEGFIYQINDVLDDRLNNIHKNIAFNNPWRLFEISLKNGVLTIKAGKDWRVQQYEMIKLKEEIENEIAEYD